MAEFNKNQFFEAIEQIAEQNLLSSDEIKSIIEGSVKKSFHSKFDPDAELELKMDSKSKVFELINHSKFIVDEEVADEYKAVEISLADAKKINSKAKEGNTISQVVDFNAYSRTLAQQIRQLITQNVREKRKEAIYAKHKGLKGEMITATVISQGKAHAILELEDGTIAFMPPKLKNPNIKLGNGEKVTVYVEDVLEESKDAQIIVSNGSKEVIRRLLESEVPEISQGIIEIVSLSRLPGERTKVAVKTNDANVDPVGAIIGGQGARIKQIISKLEGERLDVIPWSADMNEFVVNAISPAKVAMIFDKKDEEGNVIEGHKVIVTPNKHQTLAIGRRGSNARLAVELTNNRIDVLSIDEAKEKGVEIIFNGNADENTIARIESGERIVRPNSGPRRENTGFNNALDTDSLSNDIAMFNESLEGDDAIEIEDTSFDISSDFSEEDLEKMQADFEFDTELIDFEENEEESTEDE